MGWQKEHLKWIEKFRLQLARIEELEDALRNIQSYEIGGDIDYIIDEALDR